MNVHIVTEYLFQLIAKRRFGKPVAKRV